MNCAPTFRAAWLWSLVFFWGLVPAALRAQPAFGIIQVTCEPGVLVFFDGEVKGETSADVGGIILRRVAPGQHTLKFVKEGFSPSETRIDVAAGAVMQHRVGPFAAAAQVKQGGGAGDPQIVRKTGMLIIQSLPVACTIRIPEMGKQADKEQDEWQIDAAPVGEFEAVFEAAGKSMRHRVVIRDQGLTHLFVDFIEEKIHDRSPPTPTGEKKAAKRGSGPAAPPPAAMTPRAGSRLPPREMLTRARAAQRTAETEIEKIDAALKAGGAGLDRLAVLVEKRNRSESALAVAKESVAAAVRAVADERRQQFLSDYGKFAAVNDNGAVPAAVKLTAWRELTTNWPVTEAGATPVKLVWRESRADVARGHLSVAVGGEWPAVLGVPTIFIDGNERTWMEKPAAYLGHENRDLAAGRHTLRLMHPAVEPFETQFDVEEDKFAEVTWAPKMKPASIRLSVTPAGAAAKILVNGIVVMPAAGVVTVPLGRESSLLVFAPGFVPAERKVSPGYDETVEWVVALRPATGPLEKYALPVPRAIAFEDGAQIDLLWIGPGKFMMGDPHGGADEKPLTAVTLTRGFWLGKTEVTQGHWQSLMGGTPSYFKGDSLPVESVSWEDAMRFCRKLTERERLAGRLPEGYAYTLPTEAQWEYACRAGTTGDYAGNLDAMAWYGTNSASTTREVGTKQPNAWGLQDMHGNVWEWCLDWYADKLPGGSLSDPRGAAAGTFRVRRGGSWFLSAGHCRSAVRNWLSPGYSFYLLGFRVALSAVP